MFSELTKHAEEVKPEYQGRRDEHGRDGAERIILHQD